MLSKNPILVHPDTSKQYTLITDASSYANGGILTQKGVVGHLHPVSYGSAILTDAQRRWSTVHRKLYSNVYPRNWANCLDQVCLHIEQPCTQLPD